MAPTDVTQTTSELSVNFARVGQIHSLATIDFTTSTSPSYSIYCRGQYGEYAYLIRMERISVGLQVGAQVNAFGGQAQFAPDLLPMFVYCQQRHIETFRDLF